MKQELPDKYRCKHFSFTPAMTSRPNVSWHHKCALPKQETAQEKLSTTRHLRRMDSDRYAYTRNTQEARYNLLHKITRWVRVRGSGYDAERRAAVLARSLDMRRIRNKEW